MPKFLWNPPNEAKRNAKGIRNNSEIVVKNFPLTKIILRLCRILNPYQCICMHPKTKINKIRIQSCGVNCSSNCTHADIIQLFLLFVETISNFHNIITWHHILSSLQSGHVPMPIEINLKLFIYSFIWEQKENKLFTWNGATASIYLHLWEVSIESVTIYNQHFLISF